MKSSKSLFTESNYPSTYLLGKVIRHPGDEKSVESKKVDIKDLAQRDIAFLHNLEIFITEKRPLNFRETLDDLVADYEPDVYPQYCILERPGESHIYLVETDGKIAIGVICIDNFNVGINEAIQENFRRAKVILRESSREESLIKRVMKKVHLPDKYFNELLAAVKEDFGDDLEDITAQDIVEIIDASDFADEYDEKVLVSESSIPVPPNLLEAVVKGGAEAFLGDMGFYIKDLVSKNRLDKGILEWFLVEFGSKYNLVIPEKPLKRETFRFIKYAGKEDFYFAGVPYKDQVVSKLGSLPVGLKYVEVRYYKGRLKREPGRRGMFKANIKGKNYDAIVLHSQELENYIKLLPSLKLADLAKYLHGWEITFRATCKHEIQHWVQRNFLETLGWNQNANIDFLPNEQGNPKMWNKAYKRSYVKSEVEFYPQITSAVGRYQKQFGKRVTNANIQAFVNGDDFLKELHAADFEQYKRFLKQFYIALDEEL